SAYAPAAGQRSAARSRAASGWDVGAPLDCPPPTPSSPLAHTGPACCIQSGARSRAGHTVRSSSSFPTTTPRQTTGAFPLLRSLPKAFSVVTAFDERTKLSTIPPVCFVNYVPGLHPRAAHGAADDDPALGIGDVRQLIRAAGGITVRIRRGRSVRIRLAAALQRVLDGKEIVTFVGFGHGITVIQVQHERVAAFRKVSLCVHFFVFAGIQVAPAVHCYIGWPDDLKLVGVERAG